MSNDEIQKLLGGYATNTLTEAERKALFEAALEDQQLFDALHQEQALKDLLDDPISRHQIRQALEKPASVEIHAAWWTRWWAWTGAASAVVAAVLIVAVTRPHPAALNRQYASLDRAAPAPVPPAERADRDAEAEPKKLKAAPAISQALGERADQDAKRFPMRREVRARAAGARNESKDELASSLPATNAPAPTTPPQPTTAPQLSTQQIQVQAQAPAISAVPSQSRGGDTQAQSQLATGQAVNSLRDQKQGQLTPQQFGVSGGLITTAPMSYWVLKRDASGAYQPMPLNTELQTGDAVRLAVASKASGYLFLFRKDAAGNWIQVFPEIGSLFPVNRAATYTIPDVAIEVTEQDQALRLALAPASNIDADATGRIKSKSSALKKEPTVFPSLGVNITIGPRKVP